MANVLENPDFSILEGPAVKWWCSQTAYEPVFCIGSELGESFVAPGQLRVFLGTATMVDPTVSYPGLMYTGEGFNASPGDVWEISFGYAVEGPYNIGGDYTGVPDPVLFARVCGTFLDLAEDRYESFMMNLPIQYLDPDLTGVEFAYDQQFQIPATWPPGRYQFAVCTLGNSVVMPDHGLTFDLFSPSLELITGSAPPGSAPPVTDTWAFVRDSTAFPGNHPVYADLADEGFTGVLWPDTDPNAAAGIASTIAVGLQAGIWVVAGNSEDPEDFADRASTSINALGPVTIAVLDVEFVGKGYDPLDLAFFDPLWPTGWQWNEDMMTQYRIDQPTQLTAVTTLPVGTAHHDFNFDAYTSRDAQIWPQSYGATIGIDDMDPSAMLDNTIANGVDPLVIKMVLPYDVWDADVVELRQRGVYTYAVFTADDIQGFGGGLPPPNPPPVGIDGLNGNPGTYAFYPRPRIINGYPRPGDDGFGNHPGTGEIFDLEWDAWQFYDPFPNGPSLYGNLPHVGLLVRVTAGLAEQGFWYQECFLKTHPELTFTGDGFEFEAPVGLTLREAPDDLNDNSALSKSCGQHYFALVIDEFVLVPDREYLAGAVWTYLPGFRTKFCHPSGLATFRTDALPIPRPVDELRGGATRWNSRPFVPKFPPPTGTVESTDPGCGGTLSTIVPSGPHAGSFEWKWQALTDGGGSPEAGGNDLCGSIQARLLDPPTGGIPGDLATWTDAWHEIDTVRPGGNSIGDNLYIPASPGRCYTIEARETCDGIIGPSSSCTVCTSGVDSPDLDIEFRAA